MKKIVLILLVLTMALQGCINPETGQREAGYTFKQVLKTIKGPAGLLIADALVNTIAAAIGGENATSILEGYNKWKTPVVDALVIAEKLIGAGEDMSSGKGAEAISKLNDSWTLLYKWLNELVAKTTAPPVLGGDSTPSGTKVIIGPTRTEVLQRFRTISPTL